MTTKDRLLLEIEGLDEAELEALFALVRQFLAQRPANGDGNFLQQLGEIEIDGPVDFAENLDHYLSGDKTLDSALH